MSCAFVNVLDAHDIILFSSAYVNRFRAVKDHLIEFNQLAVVGVVGECAE